MGTCARLDSADALGGESSLMEQEFRVLFRVDVVRDDGEAIPGKKPPAQPINKCRLSGTDGPCNADAECTG